MNLQQKVDELVGLAAQEQLRLPMPAAEIAELEAAGHVVDLLTGDVILHGAEERFGPGAALGTALEQHEVHP